MLMLLHSGTSEPTLSRSHACSMASMQLSHHTIVMIKLVTSDHAAAAR